ncbi:hypothetical protein BC830DRAFT_1123718 [Chytriomyces sp. MP71]|nr:hypothetical protein BC830DRAFT_1123718 [Chytriomyces sp. MP71]
MLRHAKLSPLTDVSDIFFPCEAEETTAAALSQLTIENACGAFLRRSPSQRRKIWCQRKFRKARRKSQITIQPVAA